MIARELGMDRTTVQRYYDEVRAELRGEESPSTADIKHENGTADFAGQ